MPGAGTTDEGAVAQRELKQTLKIAQKKRQERLQKHNEEQLFKSREQEKKADDAARRVRLRALAQEIVLKGVARVVD